jgi:integral membrane protein (TIGR01906 family)
MILLALMANLFILSVSIDIFSLSKGFYSNEFEKFGTLEKTGLEAEELSNVSDMIIGYLKGDVTEFQTTVVRDGKTISLFNEREQTHMADVLTLFQLNTRLKVIVAVAFVLLAFAAGQMVGDRRLIFDGVMVSGFLGILVAGILLLMINVDFTKYFTAFHELFFNNDLWLLDPKTDLLIVILQEQFFIDIAVRIFTVYIAVAVGAAAIAAVLKRQTKRV